VSGQDTQGELEEIRAQLAELGDRLASLAIEALREAIAAGETKRPDLERRITRARNAIERASSILAGAGAGD
jgi:chromosome segregation ATPase